MPVNYTFDPTAIPTASRKQSYQPKVLMAEFGDGFAQRASAGPNSNPVTMEVRFENIYADEKDYIVNFLNDRGGWEAFYYTLPNDTQKAFVCQTWDVTQENYGVYTVTATFRQVYDI